MARLAGKSALVAGAGGGIGGAAAEGLAREGAAVVCGDVDLAAAEVTAEHIRAAGGRAAAIRLDVTDGDAVTAALHSVVANFGGVDILLNSAGVTMSASILELEQSEWDRVIAVNLTGAMRLGQAVARQMVAQKRGGSIIIVTHLKSPSVGTFVACPHTRGRCYPVAFDKFPHRDIDKMVCCY